MKKGLLLVICSVMLLALVGCGVWGNDGTVDDPQYHSVTENSGENQEKADYYTFKLELRQPTDKTEISEGDAYAHSTIDGELIYEWTIPMYGNTVYESVVKFFEGRSDSITFRLSQHRYYMFHDCVLENGTVYNLETVYVAANGEYSNCANYQSVVGADGIAGTDDDLKILTLVYKGWLY